MEIEDRKPKTHKGKLALEEKGPKLKEAHKNIAFIKTSNTGEIMQMVMEELVNQ